MIVANVNPVQVKLLDDAVDRRGTLSDQLIQRRHAHVRLLSPPEANSERIAS